MRKLFNVVITDNNSNIAPPIDTESDFFIIDAVAKNGSEVVSFLENLSNELPTIVVIIGDMFVENVRLGEHITNITKLPDFISEKFTEVKMLLFSNETSEKSTALRGCQRYSVDDFSFKFLMEKLGKIAERLACKRAACMEFQQIISGNTLKNNFDYINKYCACDNFILVACEKRRAAELLLKLERSIDFDGDFMPIHSVSNNNIIALLIGFYNGEYNYILEQTKVQLNGICSFFAVSRPVNIFQIYSEYQIVVKRLDYGFYHPTSRFYIVPEIFHENVADDFDWSQFNSFIDTKKLWNAVDLLTHFVLTIISKETMSEQDLKLFLRESLQQVFTALEHYRVNLDNLEHLKTTYFVLISNAACADEIVDLICMIAEDYLDIDFKYKISGDSQVMMKILNYINEHYAESLSLSLLAEKFSFNYNYLSTYFNTYNNEGFSEYINRLRIEKACLLLRNKNLQISEICNSVGYTDHSYFTKVFKKFSGCTPREYRFREHRLSDKNISLQDH